MAFSALTVLMRFAFNRGEPLGKSLTAYCFSTLFVFVCVFFCMHVRANGSSDKEQYCSFFLTLSLLRGGGGLVTLLFVLKFPLNCCE